MLVYGTGNGNGNECTMEYGYGLWIMDYGFMVLWLVPTIIRYRMGIRTL